MNCFVFYLAERSSFYQYLEGQNLAVNTMDSYCWTADFFKSHFGRFGRKSLADYKSFLLENFKPKTVNLRIQGINKYLDFAGKSKLRIKNVKVQQKSFLENVISNADYKFLKTSLLQDGQTKWYFVEKSALDMFHFEFHKLPYAGARRRKEPHDKIPLNLAILQQTRLQESVIRIANNIFKKTLLLDLDILYSQL